MNIHLFTGSFLVLFICSVLIGIILMKRGSLHILFVLRKDKYSPNRKQAPIYCRITFDKKRATEFSTDVWASYDPDLDKTNWDSKAQRIKGRSEKIKLDNIKLQLTFSEITDIYIILRERKISVTANLIHGIYNERGKPVLKFFEKYNEAKIEDSKRSTSVMYTTYLNIFREFLISRKLEKVSIYAFDENIAQDFKKFLLKEKTTRSGGTLNQNYASKCYGYLKNVFKYALQEKLILKNPITDYIPRNESNEIIYLDEDELRRLEDLEVYPSLEIVKDCAVLQCYTGMAYETLFNPTERRVEYNHQDKRNWLYYTRGKTGTKVSIPIVDKAQKVLDKYKSIDNIPKLENWQYNVGLKQLAFMCGINKEITTHSLRKTFATMALSDWKLDIKVVSAMIGHKNVRTTETFYAALKKKRIEEDMKNIGRGNSTENT